MSRRQNTGDRRQNTGDRRRETEYGRRIHKGWGCKQVQPRGTGMQANAKLRNRDVVGMGGLICFYGFHIDDPLLVR